MKNWELARRDLLKSLGVGAACLPLLSSSKVWAQGNKRFMIIHGTAGYWMPLWRPAYGPLGTLPPASKPLEPHAKDITYVLNMTNPNYKVGANWGHECYGTIYWGGEQRAPGGSKYQEPTGKTLDIMVAEGLPKTNRLTLNLQDQVDMAPSSGTTGSSRCFWRGAGQPINPESNPAKTYGALFAGTPTPPPTNPGTPPPMVDPEVKKLLGTRKSILDYVGDSLERFKVRVGRTDRGMIDGHLSSIRSLETEIAGLGMPGGGGGGGGGGPVGPVTAPNPKPEAFEDSAIMSDKALWPKIFDAYTTMMIAAFSAGITRVATLQLSNSSGNPMNFGLYCPGIPARGTGYKSPYYNWHDAGHNPIVGGNNLKTRVDTYIMERYASVISRMKAITEPGGNMLSNSLVLWGNHMESGDNHHSQRQAWVFAGGAGGMNAGQSIDASGKSINACMADICKIMGVTTVHPHWTGSVGLAKG